MPAAAFQGLLNRDFTAKSEVYCEYSAAVGQNSSFQQHPMKPALSLRQHLFSNLWIEVNNGGAGTIDSFSASSAAVNNRPSIAKLPGTTRMRLFLSQAERMGVPQNGSAARFDDLGLYLLPTMAEAMRFVQDQFRPEKE
jgi:hypothetical protein